MSLLTLIRWQNLLIIFLTQLLAWACVVLPAAEITNATMLLTAGNFLMLSLSTILIAAAGYIINDYFDIKIDNINRPQKMVLEKKIPMKAAIILHSLFNVCGLFLAFVLVRHTGSYSWLLLQLTCTILLWFYSTHFKRQFMSGNVVVAVLTALTILTLIVYEPLLHSYVFRRPFINTVAGVKPNPVWVLGVYTFFAFMLTWMREIVKDMEDFKGDAEQGCVTMPIKWGLQKSVWFIQGLGVVALIPLVNAGIKLIMEDWWILGCYTLLLLVVPIVAWLLVLPKTATQQHYYLASRRLKFIMVAGIVSLIIYYIEAHA
jgi:4-hydroxybenzoate polyprenyltransferase